MGFTPVIAEDRMSNRNTPTQGFYLGLSYVDSEIDTDSLDTSGDGEGFSIGYRFNNGLSVEYTLNQIDYDDINHFGTQITGIEGDFQFLSIMYQGRFDKWEPYIRFAYGDSDLEEVQIYTDGSSRSFSSGDTGYATGFGTDYAFTDNFSFRLEYTFYSENQEVLSLGPVYRF